MIRKEIRACERCGAQYRPCRISQRYCSRACTGHRAGATPVERFWSKVDKREPGECWPWTAMLNGGGYGRFRDRKRKVLAHRYAWEQAHGPIPAGMLVCHRCDNPRCCNPAHLFLGTSADNATDRNTKGRQARGDGNGRAKLTTEIVRDIRSRYADGAVNKSGLARSLGVSGTTIQSVLEHKSWVHVELA